MEIGEAITSINLSMIGLVMVSCKKFPSLWYSIIAASNKQAKRLTRSTTLSTITVPSKLVKGMFSALLREPHLVTSPNLGNARLAK